MREKFGSWYRAAAVAREYGQVRIAPPPKK
jgi:hypothetical protein